MGATSNRGFVAGLWVFARLLFFLLLFTIEAGGSGVRDPRGRYVCDGRAGWVWETNLFFRYWGYVFRWGFPPGWVSGDVVPCFFGGTERAVSI